LIVIWNDFCICSPFASKPKHAHIPWSSVVKFRIRNRIPFICRSIVTLNENTLHSTFFFLSIFYRSFSFSDISLCCGDRHPITRLSDWPIHNAINDLYWSLVNKLSFGLIINSPWIWKRAIQTKKRIKPLIKQLSTNLPRFSINMKNIIIYSNEIFNLKSKKKVHFFYLIVYDHWLYTFDCVHKKEVLLLFFES
jgi:hypothetical protein